MINWEFIKAELLNGTSVEELAQIAGTTYKNMWNRIRRHEVKDGVIYMKEEQLRPLKNRNSKRAKASERCPVTKKPRSPEDCAECYESGCGGKATAADPDNPKELLPVVKAEAVPVFLEKKMNIPEEKPERVTVTNSVYDQISTNIGIIENAIENTKNTLETLEKERDSWAAILATIKAEKSEDNPEGVT